MTYNKQPTTYNNSRARNSERVISRVLFVVGWRAAPGQVMLAIVIFFLAFSLALILGFAEPVLRATQSTGDAHVSRQAYYTSESLAEDVAYRLINGMQTASAETLTVASSTATSTLSAVLGGQAITTTGVNGSMKRSSKITLSLGDGIAFHYAVQAGNGGFSLKNSSSITGNVYSGGPVIGVGGNVIAGDVVSVGSSGSVYGIHATGTVYSHTIGNAAAATVIDKDAYYSSSITNTTVSGSNCPNSHCHSGSSDQAGAALPISDAQIAEWESDASVSILLSSECDTYSAASNTCTITSNKTWGPKKIPFNLLVKSTTLTVTGPLWVVGNITTQSNPTIKMSSSLGSQNVAVIADNPSDQAGSGIITITTGTVFAGSGTAGSYVFMISQNNSSETGGATDAVSLTQSSSALVSYAAHGQMSFSQSAGVKSATAYKIVLTQSANIVYDTGLPSTTFQAGPSGGYSITGWSEVLP